jgi:hypothetical protein
VLASVNARGPLALAALGIFITLLLQPMSVMTVPFAMVALGASDTTTIERRLRPKVPLLAVMGVLAGIGFVFGFAYVLSDYRIGQSIKHLDVDELEDAAKLRFESSEFMGVLTDVAIKAANQPTATDADRQRAIEIARRTAAFDSYYPGWWNFVGATEADWGDLGRAKAAFDMTLERFPWSEAGLTGEKIVAVRTGDTATEAAVDAKLCELRSPNCSTNQQQQTQPSSATAVATGANAATPG